MFPKNRLYGKSHTTTIIASHFIGIIANSSKGYKRVLELNYREGKFFL